MSALTQTQQAVFNTLMANSALRALLAANPFSTSSPTLPAIYDYVEQQPKPEDNRSFPYVVIGALTAVEFDTDEINGLEQTITIHAWDRYRGHRRVKQVIDAIYTALHKAALSVSGQYSVYCFWEFSESVPDEDALLHHGVLRFRIVTMES